MNSGEIIEDKDNTYCSSVLKFLIYQERATHASLKESQLSSAAQRPERTIDLIIYRRRAAQWGCGIRDGIRKRAARVTRRGSWILISPRYWLSRLLRLFRLGFFECIRPRAAEWCARAGERDILCSGQYAERTHVTWMESGWFSGLRRSEWLSSSLLGLCKCIGCRGTVGQGNIWYGL